MLKICIIYNFFNVANEKEKEEAAEVLKMADAQARAQKNKALRANLSAAVAARNRVKIQVAIEEVTPLVEEIPEVEEEIKHATKVYKRLTADHLVDIAIETRKLPDVETAVTYVKKEGLEDEMGEKFNYVNNVYGRLKRLEKMRQEVVNLKQTNVAEIRSYQNPHPSVRNIMIATHVLLGHAEKEVRNWKVMQALIGKTGKQGLKRRVDDCDTDNIPLQAAKKAQNLIKGLDVDTVRDISGGAGVFFGWVSQV